MNHPPMLPSSSQPPSLHQRRIRRRVTGFLFLAGVILAVFMLVYAAWQQPQRARRPQIQTMQIPTLRSTLDESTVPLFAALEPGVALALFQEIPNQSGLAVVAPGIPPVGLYLPRTGRSQFEFPTPTPLPTSTPTSTPHPSETPSPTPSPTVIAYTPSALGGSEGTAVALAVSETGCAPADLPVAGVLTQRFHQYHSGIDLGVYGGTPVLATHSGTVIFAAWSEIGYGYLVILQSGSFITYYAHLDSFNVNVGDLVSRGAVVAWSDNSGNSSGPHLHYEIRINDIPVDPFSFDQRGYTTC